MAGRDPSEFTTLDQLLEEEGIKEEVTIGALQKVLEIKNKSLEKAYGLINVASSTMTSADWKEKAEKWLKDNKI